MSDLTNCVQLFILDDTIVRDEHIYTSLTELSKHYEQEEIPVMIYPKKSAEKLGISFDKTYALTVLNLEHISPYLLFMQSLTTHRHKKIKKIS